MHEPLYSADEMRAAEARYPGYPGTADELMERAASAVAAEALRAFPTRGASPSSAARARTAATDGSPRAFSERQGATRRRRTTSPGADVVVDALFGTGFHGPPRPDGR